MELSLRPGAVSPELLHPQSRQGPGRAETGDEQQGFPWLRCSSGSEGHGGGKGTNNPALLQRCSSAGRALPRNAGPGLLCPQRGCVTGIWQIFIYLSFPGKKLICGKDVLGGSAPRHMEHFQVSCGNPHSSGNAQQNEWLLLPESFFGIGNP